MAFAASMKPKRLGILLVSLLIAQVFLNYGSFIDAHAEQKTPDIFIGIDVAYENLTEIKKLIDEVSSYTNLFIIGCTGITYSPAKLDETCQYAYDKSLSFIIYSEWPPQTEWLESAKTRWEDRFLGFYVFDEAGGHQLDLYRYRWVWDADNYTDAAAQFNNGMDMLLTWFKTNYTSSINYPLFTSDYALYWFDYKAGYDTLFAEFGWNYSRQLNIALCRGAATVQNKDWGVIIAWTYTNPPYIESGKELYADLTLAYENGAKYIVILDTNENYTQGILEKEHLNALKQFWQYVQDNPRKSDSISDRVAYVLPKDYGYGFRGPNDKIWGLWEADTLSYNLSVSVNSLLEEYGKKLDIIYDDGLEPDSTYGYSRLISWNSTSPSPSPSPSQQPTSPLPIDYAYAMATGVVITAVVAAALVLRIRRQHYVCAHAYS
jgi:hypothetical protein